MSARMVVLAAALAGCTAGQQVAMESDAQIRADDTSKLCESLAYKVGNRPVVVAELERRGDIRPEFVPAITGQRILVGMNLCEVHASWGLPEHINRTTVGGHSEAQLVFGLGDYVYVGDGGLVTAVQSSD